MVLKELIFTVSTLGRCGSLERTDLIVSTLGGDGGLERLILRVSTLQGCCDLESPGFNNFYFGRVLYWS